MKKTKFSKLVVSLSIVVIIAYTVAAIWLQKVSGLELSPTLTTCVYAFFGTELIGLAGIKICDTKFIIRQSTETDSAAETIHPKDAVG